MEGSLHPAPIYGIMRGAGPANCIFSPHSLSLPDALFVHPHVHKPQLLLVQLSPLHYKLSSYDVEISGSELEAVQ